MGAHNFKLKNVPFPTLKKVNINVSRTAATELALVPNRNVCAKFH